MEECCKGRGQGCIRFDYSGHGQSGGKFEDGTISSWADDAKAILDEVIPEDQQIIVVGSSMGGWISLLLVKKRPERIAGMVGIAAAPDFTEDMFHTRLNKGQQAELLEKGLVHLPNDNSDEPYHFTREFYEDGKNNLVLTTPKAIVFP